MIYQKGQIIAWEDDYILVTNYDASVKEPLTLIWLVDVRNHPQQHNPHNNDELVTEIFCDSI